MCKEVRFFDSTYLVIFVDFIHSSFTFFFGNDLARILHDDLVRLEAAIAADAIAAVGRLDDLDTHAILATSSSTSGELRKRAVRAILLANVAVGLVAFIQHDPVLAALAAAVLWLAHTLGLIIEDMRHLFPDFLGFANESV